MTRLAYDTDLSDDQWALIGPLFACRQIGWATAYLRSAGGGERDLLSTLEWD